MDVLDLYRQTGALLEGHFLLRSGRHSPTFLQTSTLMQHPRQAMAVGQAIGALWADLKVDFVIGPALGGVTLAFVVAHAMGVRASFAEKDGTGGMYVRQGLDIGAGERFLAVEDVITTGGSVLRAIKAAEAKGAHCVAVGAIIDRSAGQAHFAAPLRTLTQLAFPTHAPDDCPLCRAGIELQEV